MKINNKTTVPLVRFDLVEGGRAFILQDKVYIKGKNYSHDNVVHWAVNLETGVYRNLWSNEMVTPVNAEVIFHEDKQ